MACPRRWSERSGAPLALPQARIAAKPLHRAQAQPQSLRAMTVCSSGGVMLRGVNSRGKVIIGRPHSKTVAFGAFLTLTVFGALATASAQPADIQAIDKSFQDHYARGNYPAAQIDAQELERLTKARLGADHPDYAVALNKLGLVFWARTQVRPTLMED